MSNLIIADDWLRFANMDIVSAKHLCSLHPKPMEVICYHCQQTAEKAIKAIDAAHGNEPRKIHDVTILLEHAIEFAPEIETIRSSAIRLSGYSVLTRYPPTMQLSESDVDSALIDACLVLESCTAHIRGLRASR
jgi:HEPN domain-containing protein